MTDTVRLIINGPPTPQPRARIVKRGAFATAYDPHAKQKQDIEREIQRQITARTKTATQGPLFAAGVPISVHMAFYLTVAQSLTKAKREAKLNGSDLPTGKGDLDNYAKKFLDCMTGLVYHDDAQVVHLSASKAYSENPRTEITINRYSNA